MAITFKVLSALLSYPVEPIAGAVVELEQALRAERLLTARQIDELKPLFDEIATGDLYDLQERYVLLFDRTRSLSLHLFEHVHGERRDRGQAMVDLKGVYERAGMAMATSELPDYLPMFLEFLSTRPLDEVLELIGQPAHIFAAIAERLRKRQSSYAAVLSILAGLAKADPKSVEVQHLLAEPEFDPDDHAAIDAAWEDEEVRFGPTADAGCGGTGLVAKLRAGGRPAQGLDMAPQPRPQTIITHSQSRND